MFSKNFNIIIGDRASSRTTFLFELARLIRSFDHKTCYIGGTDEFYDFANNSVNKIYDSAFFYKKSSTGVRLFQNIKEITERDGYEYIFIDIDYISHDCIDILSSIRVKKIATCLTDHLPVLNQDINCYEIRIRNNYSDDRNLVTLKIGEDIIKTKDIITTLSRDQKIKSVLK
jgi:hypothetical protein